MGFSAFQTTMFFQQIGGEFILMSVV